MIRGGTGGGGGTGVIDGLGGRLSVISRSGMVGGIVAFLGREELSGLVVQLFGLHQLFAFFIGSTGFYFILGQE